MKKERVWAILLAVIVGCAGYYLGRTNSVNQPTDEKPAVEEVVTNETRAGGYEFINPLVECDCFKPSKQVNAVLLEDRLNDYVTRTISAGKATHISVYFRDLNNGPWLGIGEEDNFTPASLLKLPIMIGALKKTEEEPLFLKKRLMIKIDEGGRFMQNISDSETVVPGKSYEIQELLNRMIQHSDNRAADNLYAELGSDFMNKVFENIQVKLSGKPIEGNYISVKEYSSFFRILYNASYLTPKMSEMALKILSKSTFTAGLVAGIPKEVMVAHKFGERGINKDGVEILQLHDCGIVYSPKMPYLLCVMTRGKDFKELESIIAEISAMVYQSVVIN